MKRRTWRRWPAEQLNPTTAAPTTGGAVGRSPFRGQGKGPKSDQGRGQGKTRRDGWQPLLCPVCDAHLVAKDIVEQGVRGPEIVRSLSCPNPRCPRAHEIRASD